jgi:outer membrane immunogenic protein
MKKVLLALTAVAAFTGSALAADLPARTYSKAPVMVAPVVSWTGCWISGGGGYGISKIDHDTSNLFNFGTQNISTGADGYFGTVGAGCDYQFNNRWVLGGFVDGTLSSIKGDDATRFSGLGDVTVGQTKQTSAWAVGARIGYLVTPSFLSYFNGGYTGAHFSQINLYDRQAFGGPFFTGVAMPSQNFGGFFVGSGFEYALDFLPGLFLKTEGRASVFSRKSDVPVCVGSGTDCIAAGLPVGFFAVAGNVESRRPITYTAKTELVYHFNWGGGPVVAKY